MSLKNNDKSFIERLAVDEFNRQYNRDLTPEEVDTRSIEAGEYADVGYEIFTIAEGDSLRLRIRLTIDNDEAYIGKYRLETATTDPLTGHKDHVYTALGKLDQHYVWTDLLNLKPLTLHDDLEFVILLENNDPLLTESGNYILTEAAA